MASKIIPQLGQNLSTTLGLSSQIRPTPEHENTLLAHLAAEGGIQGIAHYMNLNNQPIEIEEEFKEGETSPSIETNRPLINQERVQNIQKHRKKADQIQENYTQERSGYKNKEQRKKYNQETTEQMVKDILKKNPSLEQKDAHKLAHILQTVQVKTIPFINEPEESNAERSQTVQKVAENNGLTKEQAELLVRNKPIEEEGVIRKIMNKGHELIRNAVKQHILPIGYNLNIPIQKDKVISIPGQKISFEKYLDELPTEELKEIDQSIEHIISQETKHHFQTTKNEMDGSIDIDVEEWTDKQRKEADDYDLTAPDIDQYGYRCKRYKKWENGQLRVKIICKDGTILMEQ